MFLRSYTTGLKHLFLGLLTSLKKFWQIHRLNVFIPYHYQWIASFLYQKTYRTIHACHAASTKARQAPMQHRILTFRPGRDFN